MERMLSFMRSKKVLYNVGTNVILRIIVILYGFVVPKIIISYYGSNVYGLITSITQFLSYISLLELGIGPVVKSLLYKPLAKKDNKAIINILKATETFFRRIAYFFLIYILILSIFYPIVVADQFDYIYTFSLIVIISISIFAEYFFGMTYRLLIQADQKNYVISIIQIITYVLSTISIVVMAYLKAPIFLLKLVSGLAFVLRPILQNLYVKKKFNLDFTSYDKDYKLKNKKDGMIQHIAYVIHTNTDVVILSLFSKLSEVSVYSIYSLINNGMRSIIQTFSSSVESTFGDIIDKNEKQLLARRFNTYEFLYLMLITIMFSCTLILTVPFVTLYTSNVKDVNYVRPVFAIIIILSEYVSVIKQLYYDIVKVAGHFKETKVGALMECIINLSVSIVLVSRYGLIGVAIGTLVAMTIRSIEIIYHTNRYIIERNAFESVKKLFLVAIETGIIITVCRVIPCLEFTSYMTWAINAFIFMTVSLFIVLVMNFVFYRKELINCFLMFGKIIKRKRKNS